MCGTCELVLNPFFVSECGCGVFENVVVSNPESEKVVTFNCEEVEEMGTSDGMVKFQVPFF